MCFSYSSMMTSTEIYSCIILDALGLYKKPNKIWEFCPVGVGLVAFFGM